MNPTRKIKEVLIQFIMSCGFVIRRYNPRDPLLRCSLQGSLQAAGGIGFAPNTIIDIGAARGSWSREVEPIWPEARYILIDPLEENRDELKSVCSKLKHADYRIAAITDHTGNININVHPDLDGSSIFLEREENINGISREVRTLTVDDLVAEMHLEPPFLLKADVQGAEMKVLIGAKRAWPAIDMIILEVLLFDIYQGNNPQIYDMMSHLKSHGFVVWDIFGMGYRMLDDALCQVDMVFVRDDGLFRRYQQYANQQQRREQLAALRRDHPRRLRDQEF